MLVEIAREIFQVKALSLSDAWGQVLVASGEIPANAPSIPLYDSASLSLLPLPSESPLLNLFIERAALLVEYLTLKTSLETERQQRVIANTLQDISLILTSQHDLKTIFSKILEQIARVIPYDAASVWLIENGDSRMIANRHGEIYIPATISFSVKTDGILKDVVQNKRALVISDIQADPRWILIEDYNWIRSWATAPIIVNDEVIGQFTLDHHELNFYNDSHLPILEVLSRQMSIAAQNAHLFEALRRSQDELQESLQLKSRFISTVSHEFRTPLAAILANSQIIERYEKRLSDEQKAGYHAKIKAQVEYLTKLVEDVLLVSKGDSVGFRLEIDRQNLKAFCEEIISEISLLAPNNIEICLETRGICEETRFDSKLLRHILFNLLSNAVKYSPQGGKIRLKINATSKQFSLAVSDEGIGIPLEEQPKLFQNFFRASNAGIVNGTGLGLTIVKRAVEAYGGQIALKSSSDKGTTVEVKLPRFAHK